MRGRAKGGATPAGTSALGGQKRTVPRGRRAMGATPAASPFFQPQKLKLRSAQRRPRNASKWASLLTPNSMTTMCKARR
jgi:hypothetical protein